MTSFSLFKYFDAFELDVNVVNFVYYGKTRFLMHIRKHRRGVCLMYSIMSTL